MPVHNNDIAAVFNQVADLLEIKGENQFRIRAYRNAARTVDGLSQSAADMIAQGKDLSELSGIGKDLAGKINKVVETGTVKLLEDLKGETPAELSDLMHVSGLGAKRVATLHKELNVTTLDELAQAAKDGRIAELEGFGAKTQESILEEIERLRQEKQQRTKLAVAEQYAEPLVDYLKQAKGIKEIVIAGSYRRRKETVRDLDILVTCKKGSKVMDRFVNYDEVQKVVSHGRTKSTVLLRSGLQVDLRVVPQVSYGSALMYSTGSKQHNIAVRKIAVKKKLKLSEYGIFEEDERVAGRTEQEVYKQVGLPFVEPELREDRGEVEAARKGKLPKLIEEKDIRGDLHVHTKRTDGHHTISELVEAARKRSYDYIAISDHSQHVTVAGGLKPEAVREQIEEIDRLNNHLKGFTVLRAIEVDILEDGSLDLPDDVLGTLDLTICSVHSKFGLSRGRQTDRILKAMDNRHFTVLGHPTGRLINEREPYEVDLGKVMRAAKDKGLFLEVNAHPDRLDLNDIYCKMAVGMGVKVAISTDTHRIDDLNYMRFGVGQARRGWLRADDVINTRSVTELKKLLKK
ncbi:MAG: DNA polymerase/3'-5' exonuclease PolX [Sedimentisphaerales bacterium]|nr:DNA polymerase/3'-5' exonuclease PolX [Sedimentisphaerales bacterium]